MLWHGFAVILLVFSIVSEIQPAALYNIQNVATQQKLHLHIKTLGK